MRTSWRRPRLRKAPKPGALRSCHDIEEKERSRSADCARARASAERLFRRVRSVTSLTRRTTRTSAVLRHRNQVQTRSLFISLSFAPYHRAPFTPSFADGGVHRSLALYLLAFPPAFPPCVLESHLTPTPSHQPHPFLCPSALAHDAPPFGSSPVRRPPFAQSSTLALHGVH